MKQVLVNLMGALGYLFVIIQWMWMLVIIGLPIATQPGFQEFFMPSTQPSQERTVAPREAMPAPVQTAIMVVSVLFSVGIVVYALVKVPSAIGRAGQQLTRKAATKAVPVITHHKKVTKKRERTLVERITWSIKAAAIAIPVLALAVPPGEMISLEHNVSVAFGMMLAVVATIAFALQFALAKLWKIDSQRIW